MLCGMVILQLFQWGQMGTVQSVIRDASSTAYPYIRLASAEPKACGAFIQVTQAPLLLPYIMQRHTDSLPVMAG